MAQEQLYKEEVGKILVHRVYDPNATEIFGIDETLHYYPCNVLIYT